MVICYISNNKSIQNPSNLERLETHLTIVLGLALPNLTEWLIYIYQGHHLWQTTLFTHWTAIPFLLSGFTEPRCGLALRQWDASREVATHKARWIPPLILGNVSVLFLLPVSGWEEGMQHNPEHEAGGKVWRGSSRKAFFTLQMLYEKGFFFSSALFDPVVCLKLLQKGGTH